jgi:hypothetical protein
MSRVLNCSVSFYGNPRRGVSGDGVVQNLLEELGYKTYGVFPTDYFFRGIVPSYDYSFPGFSSSASLLVAAILEGEFRFDIEFDKVAVTRTSFERRKRLRRCGGGAEVHLYTFAQTRPQPRLGGLPAQPS